MGWKPQVAPKQAVHLTLATKLMFGRHGAAGEVMWGQHPVARWVYMCHRLLAAHLSSGASGKLTS